MAPKFQWGNHATFIKALVWLYKLQVYYFFFVFKHKTSTKVGVCIAEGVSNSTGRTGKTGNSPPHTPRIWEKLPAWKHKNDKNGFALPGSGLGLKAGPRGGLGLTKVLSWLSQTQNTARFSSSALGKIRIQWFLLDTGLDLGMWVQAPSSAPHFGC